MEPKKKIIKLVVYAIFHRLILSLMMIKSSSCTSSNLGNKTDHLALLEFKKSITEDPNEILSSWNESHHFCQWSGVTCGRKHQRVGALDLNGNNLFGSISPHIGNLSFLRFINLINNRLHGEIPHEIGRLSRLRRFNLANNTLEGAIPFNISYCKDLNILFLGGNKLTGEIPVSLGSFNNLVSLGLNSNSLRGEIPKTLGNLSSLQQLSLAFNHLQGRIPNELSKLANLTFFGIGVNNLSGKVPVSLYNMSFINIFSVASNQLFGTLPVDMGSTLPNLIRLELGGNLFTGTIPYSLANASHLQVIDLVKNNFIGQVPNNIGALSNLKYLHLGLNRLGSNSTQDLNFIGLLSNCSDLYFLHFNENNLGGKIPASTANLSIQLNQLAMGRNQFYGHIPEALGNLNKLYLLEMEYNILSGVLPNSFGRFERLQSLVLNDNQFSGQIPSSLGNITQLSVLSLSRNKLEGDIPKSIGKCLELQYLDVSQNNLFGMIPSEVIAIPSLSVILNLSHNFLSGPLPEKVGNLVSLNALDISVNNLSGEIPTTMGNCLSLEYLNMRENSFRGSIPSVFSFLKGIQFLDLSQNNLSGQIPTELQTLSYLQYLNLSLNNLEGEIPTKNVFGNASAVSVAGNSKLCGGIPELEQPPCLTQRRKRGKISIAFKLITPLVGVILIFIATSFSVFYCRRRTRKLPSLASLENNKLIRISYRELFVATDGFSSENIIGAGSFGSVYKGKLNQQPDKMIAVKVLNLENSRASKSFVAECKILRTVRHRNLVKIMTYCSSIDSKRNEFKALVYEYMPNGNLDLWLHPEEANGIRTLNIFQRLNIAIDVASALHYLHTQCHVPIVHCDLKPSNILLHEDMSACVSDFGLARFRPKVTSDVSETSSFGIKGSIGYAAPEYGTSSEVSQRGDQYSYGIVLLEMMTGRRPTDDIFKEGLNLHNYVKKATPKTINQIMDPVLDLDPELVVGEEMKGENDDKILEMEVHEKNIGNSSHGEMDLKKCITSILAIALACSEDSPAQRIDMNEVLRKLHRVKKAMLVHEINRSQLSVNLS